MLKSESKQMSSPPDLTSEFNSETGVSTDVQKNEQSNDALLEPMQNAEEIAEENETSGIDSCKPKRRRKRNSTKLSYSARKMRQIRSKETFFERQARLERAAARASVLRAMETSEQRLKRNAYHRERMAQKRRAQKYDRSQQERKIIAMKSMKCLQEMEKIAAESEVYVIDDDSNDEVNRILPNSNGSSQHPLTSPPPILKPSSNSVQILGQSRNSTYNTLQPQISIQIPSTIQNETIAGNPPPVILNSQFYRKRGGYKRKRKIEKPDEEAVVNKQGEQVGVYRRMRNVPIVSKRTEELNSSLELGLKILAAAVPPEVHETLLGKGVIPAAPNLGKKIKTQGTATPVASTQVQTEDTKSILSVRNIPLTTIQNVLSKKGIKITSVNSKIRELQQGNKNVPIDASQPLYHLHGGISPSGLPLQQISPIVPAESPIAPILIPTSPPSTIPKIAAVHSQFTPDVLKSDVKTNKLCKILKDIEDNPVMYLGVGKEELCILSFFANCFKIHTKQMYLILRKMRQNESVEILSDVFGMPLEEVVTTIIDIIPKMAMLFRKTMGIASKKSSMDSALTRMKISVRKPNYMNDHPEEVSRYSVGIDLYYLISCTHEGFVNFVSKGFDGNSKYSSSDALLHFSKSTKSPVVYLIGDAFEKVDLDILKWKQIDVKKNASICYNMNVVKAIDDIKFFKILANSEVPLRYEFFKIIDDLVIVATMLHNIRLQ